MVRNVIACILAGGEGRRLWPLTAHHTKPAVRFGGSYRLIDFPLSNCLNSSIRQILIFPRSGARALECHLRRGWSFLREELGEYLLSMPPQQRAGQPSYRGTADAIDHNLSTLERIAPHYVLILASDHVYRMDYRAILSYHQDCRADVTVATFAIPRRQASQFGIVTADPCGDVTSFQEKPTDLSTIASGPAALLASMGIYVFTFEVLREVVRENARQSSTHDFGHDILPGLLGRYRVVAFPFIEGAKSEPAYWRDVGTIDAYWQAHMDLVGPQPSFHLDHPQWPLYTAPVQPPPTSIPTPSDLQRGASEWVTNSVIAPDCALLGGRIERSILSPGVWIEAGAEVTESILFDGVYVGRGAKIRRAILERGVVVPPHTCVGYQSAADERRFTVSDGGIIVVGYPPAPSDSRGRSGPS
jgi:glucose-1-phosphate adenylyltransferase